MVFCLKTDQTETIKTQHNMKLQYCKPETEVDLLDLEEFILYDLNNQPVIEDDLDDQENIDWKF